ncbi:MAG: hypothetical protein KDB14_11795 [Planctomycetales bacterium]|nr:hypothetical protein [Planctomycetales bacterium]
MFGIRYLKAPATTYVLQYRGGQVRRRGTGLAFFYFSPWSMIVQVPTSTIDVPFAFTEVTADFQDVTVQGNVTFRIAEPETLTTMLDYTVDGNGRHLSDDPSKLNERMVHSTQASARSAIQSQTLREVLVGSGKLSGGILKSLRETATLTQLGIEVLDVNIVSVKATPEIATAMQAEAREQLLREADEAIGARRNAAVEMERKIRENELKTERLVAEKEQEVREAEMKADIAVEEQRASLVEMQAANRRKESEAQGAALQALLAPVQSVDWRVLLAMQGGDSNMLISSAFEQLAGNAEKIGQLSITPDLLESLLRRKTDD